MSCNSCNLASQVIILSEESMGGKFIKLQCKSQIDAIFYNFSAFRCLKVNDVIINVECQVTHSTASIDEIAFSDKIFQCRISGGSLNTQVGITFKLTTRLGETIEFTGTLSIVPSGAIGSDSSGAYVIGSTGPKGDTGEGVTIKVGKVITLPSGSEVKVENVGTDTAAIFDISIPQGMDNGYTAEDKAQIQFILDAFKPQECQDILKSINTFYTRVSSISTVGLFYYYNSSTKSWMISSSDLNMGIKVNNYKVPALYPLLGKKISLLGDSISTFSGSIPFGYATKYALGDVKEVEQTWWDKFIKNTGAILLDNNSYSGSRVSKGAGEVFKYD